MIGKKSSDLEPRTERQTASQWDLPHEEAVYCVAQSSVPLELGTLCGTFSISQSASKRSYRTLSCVTRETTRKRGTLFLRCVQDYSHLELSRLSMRLSIFAYWGRYL